VNRLVAPLEQTLDASSLDEFRSNSEFHLECLVNEFREQGRTQAEAVTHALAEFGAPDRAAFAMLDEWSRGRRPTAFSRTSTSAAWWSFAWFGLASGGSLLAIQATMMWSVATPLQAAALLFSCIAPALAGVGVGYCVPTGNLRALAWAMLPLFGHSLLAGFLMGPYKGGALFSTLFVCAWVPIGALSVTVAAWVRRNRPSSRPAYSTRKAHL
jgi:hypothetical protein